MADTTVRPARPDDAPLIAAVQGAVWSQVYAGLLPPDTLAGAGSANAVATWRQAIDAPPSAQHRVLVALADDEVVGFVAMAPSSDPDLVAPEDVEVHALCVAPERTRVGHGSRLVNATADVMRGLAVGHLHVWVSDWEKGLRQFLERSGWADDGARRRLDLRGDGEVVVDQVRLATALADPSMTGSRS